MILGKVLCRSMIIGNMYWLLSILRRRISMAFSLLLHLTCLARRRRFSLLAIKLFLVTVILIVLLLILVHSHTSFILENNYHLTLVVVLVIKSVGAVAVIKFAMEAVAAAMFPSLAAVVAIKVLLLSFLLLHNSPPLHFSNSNLAL